MNCSILRNEEMNCSRYKSKRVKNVEGEMMKQKVRKPHIFVVSCMLWGHLTCFFFSVLGQFLVFNDVLYARAPQVT